MDLALEPAFDLGEAHVRPAYREVKVGAVRVILQPRVMQVLARLARTGGEPVSRDALVESCWGRVAVSEDAINRCIQRLRRLSEEEAAGCFDIETISRVGYRLRKGAPATLESAASSDEDVRRRGGRLRAWLRPRHRVFFAAAAALALVALVGLWLASDRLPLVGPVGGERVAILPFDVATTTPEATAVVSGLFDEILGVLSSNDVRVVSRAQSATLHGAGAVAKARSLGAGLILDGSVQEQNGAIVVRVHLDDPAQGVVLWSRDFEGRATAREALQAQVAARATTVAAAALAARHAGITDPAVVSGYVAACEQIIFDWDGGVQSAVASSRRIVARAPHFGAGRSVYAVALAFQSEGSSADQAEPLRREAERQAREALAIEPNSGDAYMALGFILPKKDWAKAETLYLKGLAVEPENWHVTIELSRLQQHTGRLRAAAETAARSVALDPLEPGPTWTLALLLAMTGDTDRAGKLVERMQALWPGHVLAPVVRFWVAIIEGDWKSALGSGAGVQSWPPVMDPVDRASWRTWFAAQPPADAAARLHATSEIRLASQEGRLDPGYAMTMLASLGDVDGAFAAGDRYAALFTSYDRSYPPYLFLPQTAAIRRDARFIKLAARLGLVDYSRTTGRWPDFCSDPQLPYSCKAAAAQAVSAR